MAPLRKGLSKFLISTTVADMNCMASRPLPQICLGLFVCLVARLDAADVPQLRVEQRIGLLQPTGIPIVSGMGTVVAYGRNDFGQCNVPAGLTGVKAIAAGWGHSVALKQDGTVVAWGINDHGKQSTVPAGLKNVIAIAAGGDTTAALRRDGSVVAWGYNGFGQTNVPPDLGKVTGLSLGYDHVLALLDNGKVRAWGHNNLGQIKVPAALAGVSSIAAGGDHSLALTREGKLSAWGEAVDGLSKIPSFNQPVLDVASGRFHSLALLASGQVVCWGRNDRGQTTLLQDTPKELVSPNGRLRKDIVGLGAGNEYSVALSRDGSVISWGGLVVGHNAAVKGGLQQIAAGGFHVLGLRSALRQTTTGPYGVEATKISISNTGTAGLTITSIKLDGPDAREFFVYERNLFVSPGRSDLLEVGHFSLLGGEKSAQLVLTTNDPANPEFIIPLSVFTPHLVFDSDYDAFARLVGRLATDPYTKHRIQRLLLNAPWAPLDGFIVSITDLPAGVSVLGGIPGKLPGEVYVRCTGPRGRTGSRELTLTFVDPQNRLAEHRPKLTAIPLDPTITQPEAASDKIAPLHFAKAVGESNLIGFGAVPGGIYAVEYSDDQSSWLQAAHRLRPPSGLALWTDRGQPETETTPRGPPQRAGGRYYRVKKLINF